MTIETTNSSNSSMGPDEKYREMYTPQAEIRIHQIKTMFYKR